MRHAARPRWDAIVVGGGVVGCAVLRELVVHRGWRALLVEASPHLANAASSGNTGIACTASDVAPGTVEHACLTEGTQLNLPTWRELNVPHRPAGSLYVGYSAAELEVLRRELAVRAARGDTSAAMLSAREARTREPALDAAVAGALFLPGETVVDPWLVRMHAHTRLCVRHGLVRTHACVARLRLRARARMQMYACWHA